MRTRRSLWLVLAVSLVVPRAASADPVQNHSTLSEERNVSADVQEQDPAPWHLARDNARALQYGSSYTYTLDGTGVDLYFIGTGVRKIEDFGSRVVDGVNVASDGASPYDDCFGHETPVADVAAGATFGVAKGANIVSVRAAGCDGVLTGPSFRAALAFVTLRVKAHPGVPAIVVLAFGGYGGPTAYQAELLAVRQLGVSIVVGAPDTPGDACGAWPAALRGVLSVGGLTRDTGFADWSGYGRCLDLLAPAESLPCVTPDGIEGAASGNSVAIPQAAAALAQIRQQFPWLSPDQADWLLLQYATRGIVTDLPAGTPNVLLYTRGWVGSKVRAVATLSKSKINVQGSNLLDNGKAGGLTVEVRRGLPDPATGRCNPKAALLATGPVGQRFGAFNLAFTPPGRMPPVVCVQTETSSIGVAVK